jgi:trans-aconitate 2-methyltransferase
VRWDPQQYERFADERGRPFRDLLDRVHATSPRCVIDLGCGPGTLTTLLADKWPQARIIGIDSSAEMIERARSLGDDRIVFELGDITTWSPDDPPDVIISNAALQWVPGHLELLREWARAIPADGWLAWQVPGNFGSPSHTLMRALAESPAWAAKLAGVLRHDDAVHSPAEYAQVLLSAHCQADAWETTYTHVLAGPDPVLEWVRGTGLRPVLNALDDRDRSRFEAQFAAELRAAYPETGHGTLLDFRRIFAVGHRLGSADAAPIGATD